MSEPDLSKLHSDPHPLPDVGTLPNPSPIYYIDARKPGYAQTAFNNNELYPQQQNEVKYIQADENVRITLESTFPLGRRYRRLAQTSELLVFNLPPRRRDNTPQPANRVHIAARDCLLEVTINNATFMVAPHSAQAIAIRATDGNNHITIAPTVVKTLVIDMLGSDNHIQTGAGIVHVDVHMGTQRIDAGIGPVLVDKGQAFVNVNGHRLLGQEFSKVSLYRNADNDEQLLAPVPHEYQALGNLGVQVRGNDDFQQATEDALELLRKLPCGQLLLAALDKEVARTGTPITITEGARHQFTSYTASTNEEDEDDGHFIRNEDLSGWGFSGGELVYNPAWSTAAQLPLLDLYRCLCQGWNSMSGTVFPGQTQIKGDKGNYAVDNLLLQSIGLATNRRFKFDNFPIDNTNPPAFTENGLRQALQLEPRSLP
ncbi:hemolysin [Pseudomonas sp. S37]|uniref:M91 family zinc metallopeptidase n=1 Tax=Pseudomonas sp. S37 TaxID=2767449 RepID=UPI001913A4B4|nr:M91 family zinc metallopeptidase [Pseudomonas sp. S37]MBK4995373.1 hemolysin [Pseudomonas sp. S37]